MKAASFSSARRRFLTTTAGSAMAVALAQPIAADAQATKTNWANLPKIKPGTNTSFPSLKQVEAGVLNVGYAEAGPAGGPVAMLLHGCPMTYIPTLTWLHCSRRPAIM